MEDDDMDAGSRLAAIAGRMDEYADSGGTSGIYATDPRAAVLDVAYLVGYLGVLR